MMKKMGWVLCALFVFETVGCAWFWNQKPVCDEKSPYYHDCMNPPPLPPMAAGPDAAPDAPETGEGG